MSTATAPVNEYVSSLTESAQNETALSDVEILRRVRRIQSGWSVTERMDRRREAGKRFASLLETLALDHHAA
ncbi:MULTISPECIES: hypothetical protein [Pirellulaceae]|uniref:Uncharacterized protein n=1 Tax=Aporhodopirellula rubra TaxID=980271 RepID=A0A7W5H4J1_9BACT|nr:MULTISPECIES: hypothetical protein [Pirellulaceae]EMI40996.1 hypothetical protein RRSWK_06528 [Rhodopirellula sp. SWK7]MBB3206452.1 hypothetical protein [Aporhodopirellula rubra]